MEDKGERGGEFLYHKQKKEKQMEFDRRRKKVIASWEEKDV